MAKIIACRLGMGWTGLLHIALLAVLVNLLPKSFVRSISLAGFFAVLFLIFVIPYVLHALYIVFFKMGYAEIRTNSVEIFTKVKKQEFAFGTALDIKVVGHRAGMAPKPMYYTVKMVFEQNGKKQRINLYTTNVGCFDPVVKCFRLS